MKNVLSDSTKLASYLLWEKTKHNNALDLWYCAENIAYYFESNDITSMVALQEIVSRSKYDFIYINFVRKIAYCIYLSTADSASLRNWYIAEALLEDAEWCKAVVNIAYVFRVMREKKIDTSIRSEWIRRKLEGKAD